MGRQQVVTVEPQRNILIVDDDVMNIVVFQALLGEMHQRSDKALDGKQALQLVQERIERVRAGEQGVSMYSLLLVDYNMPEIDGPKFVRLVTRLLAEAGLAIPYICCCSAYAEDSFKRLAIAAGMDCFLTKPVSNEELRLLLIKAGLLRE